MNKAESKKPKKISNEKLIIEKLKAALQQYASSYTQCIFHGEKLAQKVLAEVADIEAGK